MEGKVLDIPPIPPLCNSTKRWRPDAYDVYIGMDHFALPTDRLSLAMQNGTLHRSFQGYTTHAKRDLVALGVSAIGHIGDLYLQNLKTLKDYDAAVDRGVLPTQRGVHVSAEDRARAQIIQQIMCLGYIDIRRIETEFGVIFREHFAVEMSRHGVGRSGGDFSGTRGAKRCRALSDAQCRHGIR